MHRHVTDTGQEHFRVGWNWSFFTSAAGRKWHTKNCKR